MLNAACYAAACVGCALAVCDHANCYDCVHATEALGTTYACYWCRIDQQCHHKGSMETACFRAFSDSCVSKSMLMSCDYSDDACPPADAHMSPFETCDPRAGVARRLMAVNATASTDKVLYQDMAVNGTASTAKVLWQDPLLSNSEHRLLQKAREKALAMGIHEDHTGEVPLVELMSMANDVYQLGESPHILAQPPSGWTITLEEQQPDFGSTKFAHVAYAIYEKGNQSVLVFKGTSFRTSLTDLAMDLMNCVEGSPPVGPILRSAKLIKSLQDNNRTVLVTGHSLGAYVAEVIATTFGLAGVGFCAPGPGWHNGFKGGAGSGFRNINFLHDPAGNVLAGTFLHAQWSVYVQDWHGPQHMPDKMLKSMQVRGSGWTNQNVACKCDNDNTGFYTVYTWSQAGA